MSPEGEKPQFALKPKSFAQLNPPTAADPAPPVDVHAILRANQQTLAASEKPMDLTRRPSRKLRDYVWMMVAGNGLLVTLFLLLPQNVVTVVFCFSGVAFYSVGLTWVVWRVMDRY